MLVDDYEQYSNEKTDVVVVSRSGSDEPEPVLSAADRTFLSMSFMPSLPLFSSRSLPALPGRS